jgi:hypothetical protein
MPTDKELLARLDLVTDKLSTQVRTLAVGLVAFAGGLLVTGLTATKPSGQGLQLPAWVQFRLLLIAALALLTLLFDILQYVLLYTSTRETRKKLKKKTEELKVNQPSLDPKTVEVGYDDQSFSHRGARASFWLKLISLGTATIWLTVVATVFLYLRGSVEKELSPM